MVLTSKAYTLLTKKADMHYARQDFGLEQEAPIRSTLRLPTCDS